MIPKVLHGDGEWRGEDPEGRCTALRLQAEAVPLPFPFSLSQSRAEATGRTSAGATQLELWPNFCSKHFWFKKKATLSTRVLFQVQVALGGVEGENPVNQRPLHPASYVTIIVPVINFLPLSSKFILQYLLGCNGWNSLKSFKNVKHSEGFSVGGAGCCRRKLSPADSSGYTTSQQ